MDDANKIGAITIISGLLMMTANVFIISPFVDGQIADGVSDQVAEGYDEEADFDEEWSTSTSERAYFANSIVDLAAYTAGNYDSAYDMLGPFIYNVTTHREVLAFDDPVGTMTYSEYDVFEWCETCTWTDDSGMIHDSISEHTDITQINILWNTQRIGGMGDGVEYGEIFAKAMFATAMIEFDLANRVPSIWAAEEINATIAGASQQIQANFGLSAELADAMAPASVLDGAYASWNASAGGAGVVTPDFSVIDYWRIMYTAVEPTGFCIALTCDLGPVFVAGMGEPSETTTAMRAQLYGYYDAADPVTMTHIDWAVYALAGSTFLSNGGLGTADLTNETPMLRERFHAASGLDIAPVTFDSVTYDVERLLFDNETGILGYNEVAGIPLPNMVVYLLLPLQSVPMDLGAVSVVYPQVPLLQVGSFAGYVEPWVGLGVTGAPNAFETFLAGQNAGNMTSSDWWLAGFGGMDPLTGEYLPIGLNRGSFAGTVQLNSSQADFILNDPNVGVKSSFSAAFMYGELSGKTLPDANGVQYDWNDAFVANLYGIDIASAQALRDWVSNFYFDTVMPVLLNFVTGNEPFTTQSINNWLFGWNDAVNAYFGRFPWVSLETNDTYYGSGGISTGDRSVYRISITSDGGPGERISEGYINSDGDGICDYDYASDGAFVGYDLPCAAGGEIYGMTEHLPWRAPHRETAALGLLSSHVGNNETSLQGTVGGIADADESFDLNLIGYAIAHSVVGEETTHKGIDMVNHSVTLDPAENQIQGKLIGSATFVDAMPGALPVYLGADLDMKVEPKSNAIMYGDVEVTFYLDTRGVGFMNPDFSSDDVQPVFVIRTFSEIEDEQADDFRDAVTDNLGPMGWTNFGGSVGGSLTVISVVTLLLYVAGIAAVVYGTREMLMEGSAESDKGEESFSSALHESNDSEDE